jgi:hypothetical protein
MQKDHHTTLERGPAGIGTPGAECGRRQQADRRRIFGQLRKGALGGDTSDMTLASR